MRFDLRALIPFMMLFAAALACIPPQDCEGVRRSLTGVVMDANGNPIAGAEIRTHTLHPEFYTPDFPEPLLSTITDQVGRFEFAEIKIFLCDGLILDVAAPDYTTQTVTFSYLGWAGTAEFNEDYSNLTIRLEADNEG